MKALTLPLPENTDDEIIEIELFVGNNKKKYNYRVESFEWELDDDLKEINDSTSVSLAKISKLKKIIENYDDAWELLQIFATTEKSSIKNEPPGFKWFNTFWITTVLTS